jgi:hypothetical protein
MPIIKPNTFALLLCLPLCVSAMYVAEAQAANSTLNVSASVLARAACTFKTPTSAMNFGTLDPNSGVNATSSANFTVRCNGTAGKNIISSISLGPASNGGGAALGNTNGGKTKIEISRNNGLNSLAGILRMRHATIAGSYIPYSLNYAGTAWTTGQSLVGTIQNNADFSYSLGGTVLAADYLNADIGAYSDTVIFTITP